MKNMQKLVYLHDKQEAFYLLCRRKFIYFNCVFDVKRYFLFRQYFFEVCMNFTMENILFLGSVLIFFSILMTKASTKFGIPTLLLFLFLGMLFGSDGLGLHFYNVE